MGIPGYTLGLRTKQGTEERKQMPDISATFRNDYGASRRFVIIDTGRDPNSPPVIFDGYLEPGQSTALTLYSDGWHGNVSYQRSDGAVNIVDNITDGSVVSME
jgi:hypothetical protein